MQSKATQSNLYQLIKLISVNNEPDLTQNLDKFPPEDIQHIGFWGKQISNFKIPQSEYVNSLNTFIQECPKLEEIEFDFSQWNAYTKEVFINGIPKVYQSLEKNKQLHRISLIISDNDIQIQDVNKILENLLIMKSNLSHLELDLSYCKCQKSSLQNLKNDSQKVSYLKQLSNLNSLKLILPTHDGDSPIISHIYEELSQLKSSQLQNIDLEMNINSDIEIQIISLFHQFQNLSKLKLKFQQIDPKQFMKLQYYLSKLSKLTSLTLDFNEVSLSSLNKGILLNIPLSPDLIEFNLLLNNSINGLLAINQIVTMLQQALKVKKLTLGLKSDGICLEGAKEISKLFTNLENLEYLDLDLNKNHIQTQGAQFLATSLSTLQSLKQLTLKLENNSILSNGIESIGQSFQQLTNLHHLTLSLESNDIEQEAVKALSQSIEKMNHLTYLDINLKNTNIQEKETQYISKAISSLSNLNTVRLNFSNCSLRSLGMKAIATSFENMSNNLKSLTLNLNSTNIGPEGAQYFSITLTKLTQLTDLHLNLSSCFLGNSSYLISQSLAQLVNLRKLVLNYTNNSISSKGIKILSQSLAKLNNIYFLDLNLSENQSHNINYIGESLGNLQNLIYLKLNLSKGFCTNNSLPDLAQGLKQLKNLISIDLNLEKSKIDSTGLKILKFIGHDLSQLQVLKLNLQGNLCEGIDALCQSLKNLTNLKIFELNLSANREIDLYSIESIGPLLENLKNLTELDIDLSYNCISDQNYYLDDPSPLQKLGQSFKALTSLRKLAINVFRNLFHQENGMRTERISITSEFAIELGDSLLSLPLLHTLHLNLGQSEIYSDGAEAICNSLSMMKNLKNLYFNMEGNQLIHIDYGPSRTIVKIYDSGATAISNALKRLNNVQNLELILADNGITSQGVSYLYNSLQEIHPLTSIKLNLGLMEKQNQSQKLFEGQQSQFFNLKQLDLNISSSDLIVQFLRSTNSITSLTLHGKNLELIDSENIFQKIFQLKSLNELDICLKQSSTPNLTSINKLMNVTKLTLELDEVEDSEGTLMSDLLAKLQSLQYFKYSVSLKELSNKRGNYIGQGIGLLENLTSLELNLKPISVGKVSSEAILSIVNPFSNLKHLKILALNFEHYQIDLIGLNGISEQLSNLRKLVELKLHITGKNLENEGIQHLFESIQNLSKLKILELCLYCTDLEYLDLSHFTQVNNNLVNFTLKVILGNNTKLSLGGKIKICPNLLQLDANFNCGDTISLEEAKMLGVFLIQYQNLSRMKLRWQRQSSQRGSEAKLVSYLLEFKYLEYLDFESKLAERFNGIKIREMGYSFIQKSIQWALNQK